MTKTLAEIAIDEGLADGGVLADAARFADREGEPLVVGLVRGCDVDETALASAIRRQMRVDVVEPGDIEVDPDAIRQLARDVAWKRRAAPLAIADYGGGRRGMRVAMADPSDAVAVAEIEHRSGCRAEPVLMVLSGVEGLIERTYGQFVTKVMKREPARPAGNHRPAAPQPTTEPFRRVTDDADPALLVRALVGLLEEAGVLEDSEFEQRVIELMKAEDG